jgi:DNA-binding NarL/FixJ family response regulator
MIMPGMGGKKCLQELLRINPRARILVASGYAPDGATGESEEAGARGFVSKPYRSSEMLKTVRELLDEH